MVGFKQGPCDETIAESLHVDFDFAPPLPPPSPEFADHSPPIILFLYRAHAILNTSELSEISCIHSPTVHVAFAAQPVTTPVSHLINCGFISLRSTFYNSVRIQAAKGWHSLLVYRHDLSRDGDDNNSLGQWLISALEKPLQ